MPAWSVETYCNLYDRPASASEHHDAVYLAPESSDECPSIDIDSYRANLKRCAVCQPKSELSPADCQPISKARVSLIKTLAELSRADCQLILY